MRTNRFETENDCLHFLELIRWGDSRKPICPWTRSPDCRQLTDDRQGRKRYYSNEANKVFNVGTNTIFHNAQVDLPIWFDGINQFLNHKKGMSSAEMGEMIGVTQATAHKMQTKMRAVFAHPGIIAVLGTIIQCDETYYGQKLKFMHERKKDFLRKIAELSGDRTLLNKTPVFGMIDERGKVFSTVVPNTTADTLTPIIEKHVKKGSIMVTDEYSAYRKLPDLGYIHFTVNHSKSQYIVTNRSELDIDTYDIGRHLHNNRIEKYWAEQKGIYRGTYHHMIDLELFCKEMDFRKNYRDLKPDERIALVLKHCEWNPAHVGLLKQQDNKPNIVQEYLNSANNSTQKNEMSSSIHH